MNKIPNNLKQMIYTYVKSRHISPQLCGKANYEEIVNAFVSGVCWLIAVMAQSNQFQFAEIKKLIDKSIDQFNDNPRKFFDDVTPEGNNGGIVSFTVVNMNQELFDEVLDKEVESIFNSHGIPPLKMNPLVDCFNIPRSDDDLSDALDQAISEEDFENAAIIRDEIKKRKSLIKDKSPDVGSNPTRPSR